MENQNVVKTELILCGEDNFQFNNTLDSRMESQDSRDFDDKWDNCQREDSLLGDEAVDFGIKKQKLSLKWSENTMNKFLDLYRRHECLWNYKLEDYKNRDARENALFIITRAMKIEGLTTVDVKNKIKTIRTMYKKELSTVLRSKKSASGRVYKPRLFWFNKVDVFLRGVTARRERSANLVLSNNKNKEDLQTEMHNKSHYCPIENNHVQNNTINPNRNSSQLQPSQSQNQNNQCKVDKISQQHQNDTGDEFDAFAKLIAIQLRQLPLLNALSCQEKIQSMIKEERVKVLVNNKELQKALSLSNIHCNNCSMSNSSTTSPEVLEQEDYSIAPQEISRIIAQASGDS